MKNLKLKETKIKIISNYKHQKCNLVTILSSNYNIEILILFNNKICFIFFKTILIILKIYYIYIYYIHYNLYSYIKNMLLIKYKTYHHTLRVCLI